MTLPWRRNALVAGLFLWAVLGLLAGCSGSAGKSGSLAASIPGAGPVPTWLAQAEKPIQADYQWAAQHHDELRHIPCYCGCGAMGHDSNSACYFKRNAAGSIVGYDNHAVG